MPCFTEFLESLLVRKKASVDGWLLGSSSVK